MTPATLIMAYYDNPGMLEKQFDAIESLPAEIKDLVSVTIVDDGSPRWPARPRALSVPLQIWRIDVDVRWNQDAARNIGVAHAETNWLLLTDIDHIVPLATWEKLVLRTWDAKKAFRFHRVSAPKMEQYKFHPNSWWMTRALFEKIGGYDERFAGFYGSDADFRDRVADKAEIHQMKEYLIRVPRQVIPDASTTTYLRKQPEDRAAMRRIRDERSLELDQSPKRFLFPYYRVFPIDPKAVAKAEV